jgi:outer membrane lipoprotein SlyB
MKNSPSSKILVATVVALAALLLAGCHQKKHEVGTMPSAEQAKAEVDTTKEDTIKAFYERMMRWKVLNGGDEQVGER